MCRYVGQGEAKHGDIRGGVDIRCRCLGEGDGRVGTEPNITQIFGEPFGQSATCLTNVEFINLLQRLHLMQYIRLWEVREKEFRMWGVF